MRKMKLLMYWFFIVFYGCIYIGVYVCGEVFKPSRIAMLAFIFSSLFTVLLLRKRVRLDM